MRLGQTVVVKAVYRRKRTSGRDSGSRIWEPRSIVPRDGLYIGWRTLSNGVVTWDGDDFIDGYSPNKHFKAALVVFSEREKPVLVPLDAIQE